MQNSQVDWFFENFHYFEPSPPLDRHRRRQSETVKLFVEKRAKELS